VIRIKRVTESLVEKVLPLIKKYQGFYRVSPNDSKNKKFFRELARSRNKGVLLMALDTKGSAIGFATLYFLPSSLSAQTACVLNDLYTIPRHRGAGVARTLLQACKEHALARGFNHLEWQTEASNARAQRLYGRLPASKSEWLHYSMKLL
jgi:GNAT superfamily N-acetyltransferase